MGAIRFAACLIVLFADGFLFTARAESCLPSYKQMGIIKNKAEKGGGSASARQAPFVFGYATRPPLQRKIESSKRAPQALVPCKGEDLDSSKK